MDDWKTRILTFVGLNIFITDVGLVAGTIARDDLGPYIDKPMSVIQTTDGQRGMIIMPGAPDKFYLLKEPSGVWPITKKETKDNYIKHTTNLVLATTIPGGNKH